MVYIKKVLLDLTYKSFNPQIFIKSKKKITFQLHDFLLTSWTVCIWCNCHVCMKMVTYVEFLPEQSALEGHSNFRMAIVHGKQADVSCNTYLSQHVHTFAAVLPFPELMFLCHQHNGHAITFFLNPICCFFPDIYQQFIFHTALSS